MCFHRVRVNGSFSVGLVLCFLRYFIWQGKYILRIVYDAMFSRISEISGEKKE